MKKVFNIISTIIHLVYFSWCALGVSLCMIYYFNYTTDFGSMCADWALDVCCLSFISWIFVIPSLLVSNIISAVLAKSKKERIGWIALSIISPIIVFLLSMVSIIVLVATTGGV